MRKAKTLVMVLMKFRRPCSLRLMCHWIAIVLFGMASASCVPTATQTSLLRPDQPLPAYLGNAPDPAWRIPVKASEIEFAELLDDRTLLMTTSNVSGYMQVWGLSDHEVVLADIASGEILWRIDFSVIGHGIKRAFAFKGLIYVAGIDYRKFLPRVTALDRQNGDIAWSRALPDGFTFALHPAADAIIAAGPPDQLEMDKVEKNKEALESRPLQVKTLDALTGRIRWEKQLEGVSPRSSGPACDLILSGEDLLIVGAQVGRMQLRNGTMQWHRALDPDLQSSVTVAVHGPYLLLGTAHRLDAFRLADGEPAGSHAQSGGGILAHMSSGDDLFVMAQNNEYQANALQLLRAGLDRGRIQWRTPISAPVRSALFLYEGRLFLSTRTSLLGFDARNGRGVFSARLPEFMHTDFGLPDHILVQDGTVIVAREVGIAAFDRKSGRLRYAHAVQGTDVFTHHVAGQRLLLRQLAKSGGGGNIGGYTALTAELQRQVIRFNTGTEPQFAQNVSRTELQAQAEATMAAANMAASIASAGIGFREVAVSENMQINEKEIIAAQACHALSIQHGYYLRPFYRDGWGVTLVRLADGMRADLFVSAPNEPLMVNSGNFPLILVDPVRRRLLVNGIGKNPDASEIYQKVGFGKDVFKMWPGIPPKWILPYTAVFGYDLDAIAFKSVSTDKWPPAPPVLGEKEQRLRDAILARNEKEVTALVESGADVNAIDQAGFNSLFYAGMADHKDIVQILIDAGADATLRDPHGLLAYHYTFFTRGDNRSTMVIRKANLEQHKIIE